MRVGVFGGTFDPPHLGHVAVATELARAARLDRVLWTPAADPPHKRGRTLLSARPRAQLVRTVVGCDPRFSFCALELERGGPSYMADTLRVLRAARPGWRFSLLLGADQMARFGTWKEPDAVASLAQLLVAARDGRSGQEGGWRRFRPRFFQTTAGNLSSTVVRERARERASLSAMVTSNAMALIDGQGLYRDRPAWIGAEPLGPMKAPPPRAPVASRGTG